MYHMMILLNMFSENLTNVAFWMRSDHFLSHACGISKHKQAHMYSLPEGYSYH